MLSIMTQLGQQGLPHDLESHFVSDLAVSNVRLNNLDVPRLHLWAELG
jgi:hypothetical protein